MKSLIVACVLGGALAGAAHANTPAERVLVTPGWLAQRLEDPNVVVLHVAGLQADYDREHIPGARFLWPTWLAGSTPEGSLQVPEAKKIEQTLEKLGISDQSQIVLCHVLGDVATTARMYVTLDYAGLGERTYILNGGLEAWKAEGRPVTTAVSEYRKGSLSLRPRPEVIADVDDVAATSRSSDGRLVDARSARAYDSPGGSGVVRGGHIPGAINLPFTAVTDSVDRYLPPDSLKALFGAAGLEPGNALVAYCNTGRTASPIYVVAKLLGYDVRLYDGSFEEWSRRLDLPVEMKAAE